MSSSDDDDDDLLLQPVKIGGVELGLNEDEIMAPPPTAESVEYEPMSPSKALASKNLVAPDSGNSRHCSQESDASSPAPGRKRTSIDRERSSPVKKKKSSSRYENDSDDFGDASEDEAAGGSQGRSQGSSTASQKKSSSNPKGGDAAKSAAPAATNKPLKLKPPKAKKLGQVRSPGPPTESLKRFEEDAGHADVDDFVWLQLKFALRDAHVKDEHKTTWWPARRVSVHCEKIWLDDLELRVPELDENGGVSLYMLFDDQNSLVAESDKRWRPFDWAVKARKKHATEQLPYYKRRWSEALVADLETSKAGHTVVKKDVKPMLKRARRWLKRCLKDAATSRGDISGEVLTSSDEEDLEEVAAAARARVQRLNEAAVKLEDLLPEVLQAGDVIEYHDPRAVKDLSAHSKSRRIATVLEVRPSPNIKGGTGEQDKAASAGYAPLVLSNHEGAALTVESEIRRLKTMVPVTSCAEAQVAAPEAVAPEAAAALVAECTDPTSTEPLYQTPASTVDTSTSNAPSPPLAVAAANVRPTPTPIRNPMKEWKKNQAVKPQGGNTSSSISASTYKHTEVVSSSEVASPAVVSDLETSIEAPPAVPAAATVAASGGATAGGGGAPVEWQLVEAEGAVWRLLSTYTLKPGRGDPGMGLESDQKRNAAAMTEAQDIPDSEVEAIHDRIFKDDENSNDDDGGDSESESSSDDDDENNKNDGSGSN